MAKQKMLWYINISKISKSICIVLIFLSMIVCLSYCFKLTSKLSKYNDDLESEVALHTQKLKAQLEKMESLQSNTIIAMANLIETRDGETGEHVKRTSDYVRILAKAAQARGLYPDVLTDEYIDLLVKAAPVHDIGKISIPDSILKKPGRLTPEEFEVIKIHASEGGTIVHTIFGNIEDKKYVEMAATVAAAHHEKWSGEGYPYHLAGEDIPLCARIMAISDVFDALVSKRCYKDAMPVDSAFEIIRESAGSHFDPTLANIFIECRSEIEKVLCE
jgi:response regulator RpfG family c-di-GMP phosphodiesterase